MKDKIKTFEEFEARMKSQEIPPVQRNIELERKKIYKPIYLRASFIAIFLSICVTASIATAMNYTGWKLFNAEGQEVFEMKTMSEEEEAPHRKYDEVMEKYRVIKEKLSDMPKGKFRYFLAVDGYEELGMYGGYGLTMLHNGEKIDSVMQIPKELKELLLLKEDLQVPEEVKESLYFEGIGEDKLVLTEGTIYYNFPAIEVDGLAKDMYAEAKENNVEYIVREGTLTDDIREVKLLYSENKEGFGGIEITLQSANEGMSTTENLASSTKLTENGVDYLYDPVFQQVYFVIEDDTKKFIVTIRFTTKWEGIVVAKEDVLAIAKSILK
ncbi:hypothetical protein [Psychrobacillus sp.]|uniref:hypothetical protein n=1 Tax=Psychrobacillus sp. TaxID=1871623 RepID=UPI0028BD5CEC|nr:hypothetical protein [Psychrobacillus sp.]